MPLDVMSRTAKALADGNDRTPVLSPAGFQLPLRTELERRIGSFFDDGDRVRVPSLLREDIERVLGVIYDDEGNRSVPMIGAAEAVVIADGSRPVFFFEGDRIIMKGAPNGPYVDAVLANSAGLERASRSVGRIETFDLPAPEQIDVFYEGTCFLVGPDLVMTNRHVVERMIYNPAATASPWQLRNDYCVNFDGQLGGVGRRFRVDSVAWMGPRMIGDGGDFTLLDMALLRLGGPFAGEPTMPDALSLTATKPAKEQTAALIGYPASARIYLGEGAPPPGYELERVLFETFDNRFGYKRCASGRISAAAGQNPRDSRKWAVAYDLSTLGGNSGSPLILIGADEPQVSALHFYGESRRANYGHVLDQLGTILSAFGISLT